MDENSNNTDKVNVAKDKGGRPLKYTQELADKFCELIANGMSLRSACKEKIMPAPATIFKWIRENEMFLKQYEKATQERTEAMAEDLLDIVDDGTNDWMTINRKDGSEAWQLNGEHVQRSRLRADTRKWLMAKMKPKKYGDKVDITSDFKALPQPIYGGLSIKTEQENPPNEIL